MSTLIERLKNPEDHYELTDPKKANAVLMSLCQEAADALATQHEPENEPHVSLASVQDNDAHYKGVVEGVQKLFDDKRAQPAPVQEPMSMRMPKVGDKVVCIEDESLGTVVYLTAGGSPEIKFDDGSRGTYMLREFAELFGYTNPPAAQRKWIGLTDEEIEQEFGFIDELLRDCVQRTEAKLKEKNT